MASGDESVWLANQRLSARSGNVMIARSANRVRNARGSNATIDPRATP